MLGGDGRSGTGREAIRNSEDVFGGIAVPIAFYCPTCSKQYHVKEELAGKTAKCGKCGNRMKIPGSAPPPSSTPRAIAPPDDELGTWLGNESAAPAPRQISKQVQQTAKQVPQ